MSDCCDPAAYPLFFDGKEANRRLKRYRRRGLDKMAGRLVSYLRERDLTGRSVLEVGGGIGDLQVELLKSGAESAVNVELSSEYEDVAADLGTAEGLSDRIERRLGDFVETHDQVESADVVVLNRVICCYPAMQRMMDASISKSRWLLAVSVPRDRALARLMVRLDNAVIRLRGCAFKSYVHPVAEMEAIAARAGLSRVFSETGLVWKGMVFERD